MAPTLRSRVRAAPRLCRMTALVPVELTASGRRHARKLCLEPGALYLYTTSDRGATRYHLIDAAHADRVFDRAEAVPEHRRVA